MRDIDIWSTPLRLLYDHEDQHHYWPQDFWTPEHQQDCRSWGWASDYQMPSLVLLIQEFRGQNILMSLLCFLRWISKNLLEFDLEDDAIKQIFFNVFSRHQSIQQLCIWFVIQVLIKSIIILSNSCLGDITMKSLILVSLLITFISLLLSTDENNEDFINKCIEAPKNKSDEQEEIDLFDGKICFLKLFFI